MAKIISLATSRRKVKRNDEAPIPCDHKSVTAYRQYRDVRCSCCGEQLDPFDVLVDMIQSAIPPGEDSLEENRFCREVLKRKIRHPEKKGPADG